MFLHLGDDISVRARDVIAIHDYAAFLEGANRDYLAARRREGCVTATATARQKAPKSLVITDGGIYLSAISPGTLKRRSALAFGAEEGTET